MNLELRQREERRVLSEEEANVKLFILSVWAALLLLFVYFIAFVVLKYSSFYFLTTQFNIMWLT